MMSVSRILLVFAFAFRIAATALAAPAATASADEDTLVALPASKQGWYEDKIHYFEQADSPLWREGEMRWHRRLHEQLGLSPNTEFSLFDRTRFESVSHPFKNGQRRFIPGTTRAIAIQDFQFVRRTRVRLGQRMNDFWVLFEGQDSRAFDTQVGENNGTSVFNKYDIQQGFLSYTDRSTFGSRYRSDVHLGRFSLDHGSRRLLARNVFANGTNAFDGAHFNFARGTRWRARSFYTMPVLRDVEEPDNSFSKRTFWGLLYENNTNPRCLVDAAYLGINDKVSPARASQFDFATYNARVRREPARREAVTKAKHGLFDYEAEVAVQDGDRGLVDFRTFMMHAEMGYTFPRRWLPRVSVQHDHASGSPNPGVGTNRTFDRLFGARVFDLDATGNYGPFFRSNLESTMIRVELRPRPDLTVVYRHGIRRLEEARDALSGSSIVGFAALRDPTGRAGTNLGHDNEIHAVKRFNVNHQIELRLCHWWKGSWLDRLPASAGLPPGGNADTDYITLGYQFRI